MQRIDYLEGLRGVVAMVVVFEHLMKAYYPTAFIDNIILTRTDSAFDWLSYPPFNLLHNGAWAVTLFFVLSGYVLALKSFEQSDLSGGWLLRNVLARYLRLALPVTASLLMVSGLTALDAFYLDAVTKITGNFESNSYDEPLGAGGAVLLGMRDTMFAGRMDYNPPLWTMAFELYGSIAIFLIIPTIALFKDVGIGKASSALFYALMIAIFHKTLFIGFVIGIVLAHASLEPRIVGVLEKNRRYWVPVAFLAGLYLCGYMVRGLFGGAYTTVTVGGFDIFNEYLYNSWGAGLILAGVLYSHRLQKALSGDLVRQLGAISFSMYLTHYIVIATFGSKVYLWLSNYSHEWATAGAVFTSMIAIFAVAVLFDTVVNKPSVVLSNKVKRINIGFTGTRKAVDAPRSLIE